MRQIRGEDPRYNIQYEGGRLADVILCGHAVECVQVRGYDFAHGKFTEPEPTATTIRRRVKEFLDESGGIGLYIENALPR